jgi:hypothetical protein
VQCCANRPNLSLGASASVGGSLGATLGGRGGRRNLLVLHIFLLVALICPMPFLFAVGANIVRLVAFRTRSCSDLLEDRGKDRRGQDNGSVAGSGDGRDVGSEGSSNSLRVGCVLGWRPITLTFESKVGVASETTNILIPEVKSCHVVMHFRSICHLTCCFNLFGKLELNRKQVVLQLIAVSSTSCQKRCHHMLRQLRDELVGLGEMLTQIFVLGGKHGEILTRKVSWLEGFELRNNTSIKLDGSNVGSSHDLCPNN